MANFISKSPTAPLVMPGTQPKQPTTTAKVPSSPPPVTTPKTSETMRQQVHQSQSATGTLRQLSEQSQTHELGHQLKSKSSSDLTSQAHELSSALGQTGLGRKLSSAKSTGTQAVTQVKAVVKSGQETAKAFQELQKSPSPQNLQKLGKKLSKHEKAVENAVTQLPGGTEAVQSAKKSLGKANPLKQLAEIPGVKQVISTVKDGSKAYKDIQACVKDPSAVNIAKATCSTSKAAATTTVAVTAGLVALGVVSAPVSVPILAVGAAIGGIAAFIKSFLPKSEPPKPVATPAPPKAPVQTQTPTQTSKPAQTDKTPATHHSHHSHTTHKTAPKTQVPTDSGLTGKASAVIKSGQETAQAFKQVQKEPSAKNLEQLGNKLAKHEKSLEHAVSQLPGGTEAVKSARKTLSKVDSVKQLVEVPVVKAVTSTLKEGAKAYKDVQACVKDPSAVNVAKASCSTVKVGATATAAVTTGLVALGVISAPVSVPILAVSAAIGGIAYFCRKWLS